MRDEDEETRLEELTSAWRPRRLHGGAAAHPLWHDLDQEQRLEAHRRAELQRALEAALDPEGLSTTAHLVLERIRRAGQT